MMKPELLSPAGDMESLYAAVSAGCDAVYLGGYTFGARSFASNFSLEEMKEAIRYCHLYGVKVYVTVNTIIYESEMEMLLDYVDQLVLIHVDALIIQDLGALDLLHQTYPELELHASTQMHLHNVNGVKMALSLGCKRVVLARETPIEKVKQIKEETGAEIELFVHGALCVSYSGQCLMSQLIGGRSGNRGSCAGSCRQKYQLIKMEHHQEKVIKDFSYLLSMKDLYTLEHIDSLIELGVDSFKIEGRMKSPSYVYLVTSLYRHAIDDYFSTGQVVIDQTLLQKLTYIFHRKFTKGFLFHDENQNITNSFRPNHLGVKIGTVLDVQKDRVFVQLQESVRIGDGIRIVSKEDTGCFLNDFYRNGELLKKANRGDVISFRVKGSVTKGDMVMKTYDVEIASEIESEIREKKRRVPVDMKVSVAVGSPFKLWMSVGNHQVMVESDILLEAPKKQGTSKERMVEQLSKLGNTVYCVRNIEVVQEDEVFFPISVLNEVRRKGVEALNQARLYRALLEKKSYRPLKVQIPVTSGIEVSVSNTQTEMRNMSGKKRYVENLASDLMLDSSTVLKLSNVMEDYPKVKGRVLVEELGGLLPYDEFETGLGLNVSNSYTVHLLHRLGAKEVTLSSECNLDQIRELMEAYQQRYQSMPNVSVVMRSIPKMMTTKYTLLPFDTKKERYALKDRFGNLYPMEIKNHKMHLYYNRVIEPYYKEEIISLGIQNLRYEFLWFEHISGIQKLEV